MFFSDILDPGQAIGDGGVGRSLADQIPFDAGFRGMNNRTAWHEIWGGAGLDDRTRHLLVLAITASLRRSEEVTLHVRVGLKQGGVSRDELKEVLTRTAIYADVPAAQNAVAEVDRIIAEIDGGIQ